jgi:hypothetical protein
MAKDNHHFFDNPKNVQMVLYVLYGCCTVLFFLDFIIHRHTVHPWERLLGFYAIYGFVGCVALVIVSTWMRSLLMRDEEYYHRDELEDVQEHQGDNHVGH